MATGEPENITQTYFGLRLGLFVLAVMLFISVGVQLFVMGCMQSSISAYYYTPVRPVLVAALCAIGAGLIIYKGNTVRENLALDIAGFLAIIVAFVPTGFDGAAVGGCAAVDVPDKSAAVANNVLSVGLAGVVAVLVSYFALRRGRSSSTRYRRSARVAFAVCGVLLVTLLLLLHFARGFIVDRAHPIAAVLFFVLILYIVLLNALGCGRQPYRRWYFVFFWGPIAVGLALLLARWVLPEFRTVVFWLEAVGIAGFAGFWLTQTAELGGFVERSPAGTAVTRGATSSSGGMA